MERLTMEGTKIYIDSAKKEALKTISLLKNSLKNDLDIKIKIRLHSSRKSFDQKIGRKTESWLVGNTNSNNTIDILDPKAFEKESSHRKENFSPILKHEISHVFIREASPDKEIPMWLNEGLAMYFAEQTKKYSKTNLSTEKNFINKIATQPGWNKYANGEAYRYSALFVDYLITKYSLEKTIFLLKSLNKNYTQKTFDPKFKKIFGVSPEKVENDFLKNLLLL